MYFVFALFAIFGFAGLPAGAQSGRTFYIDYAGGSNANNGTSPNTPWKTHPYMQTSSSCTGTGSAPTYSHQAGDRFIFKGGVSWPAPCFKMNVTNGGASNNSDYYGVDLTWFTGGSFTRPKFDLAQNVPVGNVVVAFNSNIDITMDSIEIANQGITATVSVSPAIQVAALANANTLLSNLYIHDWITNGAFTNSPQVGPGYDMGGIEGYAILDHSEISDANGFAFNSTGNKITVGFGGACHNCQSIQFSKIHDTMAASFTVSSTHDSEFYNINQTLWDTAPPTGFGLTDAAPGYPRPHTQVIEDDSGTLCSSVYNNLIHDNPHAGVTIYVGYCSNVYNNVLWNNANNNIVIGANSNATGLTGYVLNNTVDGSNGTGCFGADGKRTITGTVNVKNNHWITNGTAVNNGSTITALSQVNNVTMGSNTASAQGYTSGNDYAPTSANGGTVNAAANLATLCVGGLGSLCADRLHVPRLSSWDAGAYVFGSQQTTKPNPPSNLAAIVQ